MKASLCVIEKQKLYHELYETTLNSLYNIQVVSETPGPEVISFAVSKYKPSVLLIGTRMIDKRFCDSVIEVRENHRDVGILILLAKQDYTGVELFRNVATVSSGGLALFLKQSIDSIEQLRDIVNAVSRGQIIIDPSLSQALFNTNSECLFLKQMTNREREIMSLIADGYTNNAIARTLFIDLKTVEHHINIMYSKIRSVTDLTEKHPRVQAARLYLEATGELKTDSVK